MTHPHQEIKNASWLEEDSDDGGRNSAPVCLDEWLEEENDSSDETDTHTHTNTYLHTHTHIHTHTPTHSTGKSSSALASESWLDCETEFSEDTRSSIHSRNPQFRKAAALVEEVSRPETVLAGIAVQGEDLCAWLKDDSDVESMSNGGDDPCPDSPSGFFVKPPDSGASFRARMSDARPAPRGPGTEKSDDETASSEADDVPEYDDVNNAEAKMSDASETDSRTQSKTWPSRLKGPPQTPGAKKAPKDETALKQGSSFEGGSDSEDCEDWLADVENAKPAWKERRQETDWLDDDPSEPPSVVLREPSSNKSYAPFITDNMELYTALLGIADLHFGELDIRDQEVCLRSVELTSYKENEIILLQGELSMELYLVLFPAKAELHVSRKIDGAQENITRLRQGQYFGQRYFLTKKQEKRNATVRAMTDVRLGRISPENMHLWSHFRTYLLMKEVPLLKSLPHEERREMQRYLQLQEYADGEYIVRQGEHGDKFYIINEGSAEVIETVTHKDGTVQDVLLTLLYEGHFFGEMALIYEEPRVASVRAVGRALCMYLTKEAFRNALSAQQFQIMMQEISYKRVMTRELREKTRERHARTLTTRESVDTYRESLISNPLTEDEIAHTRLNNVQMTNILVRRKLSTGDRLINKYLVLEQLGRGTFGGVYLCRDEETGKLYAMKMMTRSARHGKLLTETIRQEIAVMKKLRHENIVTLHEVIDDPSANQVFLVQELMERGPIMTDPMKGPPVPVDLARRYFRDMLKGLSYLHSVDVVHRDIKPQNMLLAKDGTVKMADFGTAALSSDAAELISTGGTPAYMAPELFQDAEQARKYFNSPVVDIWSLGATLYNMAVGKPPWMAANQIDLAHQIQNIELNFPTELSLDPHLKNLLRRMLQKDPERRMYLEEIIDHDWVTNEGAEPLITEESTQQIAEQLAQVQVTEVEVEQAVTVHPSMLTLLRKRLASARKGVKKAFRARKREQQAPPTAVALSNHPLSPPPAYQESRKPFLFPLARPTGSPFSPKQSDANSGFSQAGNFRRRSASLHYEHVQSDEEPFSPSSRALSFKLRAPFSAAPSNINVGLSRNPSPSESMTNIQTQDTADQRTENSGSGLTLGTYSTQQFSPAANSNVLPSTIEIKAHDREFGPIVSSGSNREMASKHALTLVAPNTLSRPSSAPQDISRRRAISKDDVQDDFRDSVMGMNATAVLYFGSGDRPVSKNRSNSLASRHSDADFFLPRERGSHDSSHSEIVIGVEEDKLISKQRRESHTSTIYSNELSRHCSEVLMQYSSGSSFSASGKSVCSDSTSKKLQRTEGFVVVPTQVIKDVSTGAAMRRGIIYTRQENEARGSLRRDQKLAKQTPALIPELNDSNSEKSSEYDEEVQDVEDATLVMVKAAEALKRADSDSSDGEVEDVQLLDENEIKQTFEELRVDHQQKLLDPELHQHELDEEKLKRLRELRTWVNQVNLKLGVRFGVAEVKGTRSYMEDRTTALATVGPVSKPQSEQNLESVPSSSPTFQRGKELRVKTDSGAVGSGTAPCEMAFFGIYDGHNGDETAEYLRDNFHMEMHKAISKYSSPESSKSTPKKWGRKLSRANKSVAADIPPREELIGMIENACLVTDEQWLQLETLKQHDLWLDSNVDDEHEGGVTQTLRGHSHAGATCVFMCVHEQTLAPSSSIDPTARRQLIVGNVGDCRAVLSVAGNSKDLTIDHKPMRPDEKQRIENAGGWVHKERLNGILAVSRAFGDSAYKTYPCEPGMLWGPQQLLISKPEVTIVEVTGDMEFVILASDGLWDVLTSQQAVNYVRWKLALHGDVQRAATEIVAKAEALGSADNISAVVVSLNQVKPAEKSFANSTMMRRSSSGTSTPAVSPPPPSPVQELTRRLFTRDPLSPTAFPSLITSQPAEPSKRSPDPIPVVTPSTTRSSSGRFAIVNLNPIPARPSSRSIDAMPKSPARPSSLRFSGLTRSSSGKLGSPEANPDPVHRNRARSFTGRFAWVRRASVSALLGWG